MKTTLVIHHSDYRLSTENQWEKIKALHKSKGWGNNSAYHFFIDQHGQIYEGRRVEEISAGTRNAFANANYIHICLAGDFTSDHPTDEQVNSLKKFISARKIVNILGHRDCSASACPGDNLYKLIPDLMPLPDWGDGEPQKTVDEMKAAGITTDPKKLVSAIPIYQLFLAIKKFVKYLIK